MSETSARANRLARVTGSLRRNGLITRRGSPPLAGTADTAAAGVGTGMPTSWPGDGGGSGTSGRGVSAGGATIGTAGGVCCVTAFAAGTGILSRFVAAAYAVDSATRSGKASDTPGSVAAAAIWGISQGVAIDGVGRDGYGRFGASGALIAGVGRRNSGDTVGDNSPSAGVRRGVSRGGIAVFVNGVVIPTEIRTMAPQTLHRARTPLGGTLAGSTRNMERHS